MSGLPERLLVASNNAGKLREFGSLLGALGIVVVPQGALAIPEAAEPYPSFVENALAKARHAAQLSGLAALADDSGLCVDALDGAPGVQSARYAGEPRDDARNNAQLLAALAELGATAPQARAARFVCTLVLVRQAGDPDPLVAQGRWHGRIALQPAGSGGFGYDPLFELPGLGFTAAELPAERKNQLSHRAQALQRLLVQLRAEQS